MCPVLRASASTCNAVYKNVEGKSNAALNELIDFHKTGRPVLVGTTSVRLEPSPTS